MASPDLYAVLFGLDVTETLIRLISVKSNDALYSYCPAPSEYVISTLVSVAGSNALPAAGKIEHEAVISSVLPSEYEAVTTRPV